MESVVLLTKEIWISTPLVLGIVVCVAQRLISYKVAQLKCYVLVERSARLELGGYDSVVWLVVLEACASDTL